MTTSLVYLPVCLTTGLFDGLTRRRLGTLSAAAWSAQVGPGGEAPPQVRFLPALCPQCGWQLDAGRDSLVLLCRQCGAAWQVGSSRLEAIDYGMPLAQGWTPAIRVPIWLIQASIDGLRLDSWADLARFANFPQLVQPEWETEPLEFAFPAFRCQAEQFLRLARAFSMSRQRLEIPAELTTLELWQQRPDHAPVCPVTLPVTALAKALKLHLADLAQPKTKLLPLLSKVTVSITRTRLIYLPLAFNGTEYVHPRIPVLLHHNLLAHS